MDQDFFLADGKIDNQDLEEANQLERHLLTGSINKNHINYGKRNGIMEW